MTEYPKRFLLYDDEEGMALLQEIASARKCSKAAALRQLIREEAGRARKTKAGERE